MARLTGKSIAAVQSHARTLGLTCQAKHIRRAAHVRSAELDARIRAGWPTLKGAGAVSAFAVELGLTRSYLSACASRLNLTMPHRKEPPWTAAEDELLRRVRIDSKEAAERAFRAHGFTRSGTAIWIRAARLKISRRRSDVFSATSAAKVLGVDPKTISIACQTGELAASKRGTRRLVQQGGDNWLVTRAALKVYVIETIARLDIRKVDKLAFVDLLVADDKDNGNDEGTLSGLATKGALE